MRFAGTVRFLLGAFAAILAFLLAGELFLRLAPPDDLRPYLGAASGLEGPYVADPVLGADYRSYDAFAATYAERLQQLHADNRGRPVWAMFGNSFVQAVGMLGDTAQDALPQRQIFHLKRNEPIYLRIAQFRLLLANGIRPERVFFVHLPIDILGIALDPVASVEVTPGGAIGRKVRKPDFLAPFLDNSRLALAAWTRSGRHRLLPDYKGERVLHQPPELVTKELDGLYGEVAKVARQHHVPVTIVYLPDKAQLFGDTRTSPQDAYRAVATRFGLDFLDSSPAFAVESNKSELLISDGHLSARGNRILLEAILAHLGRQAQPASLSQ